MQEKPAPVSCYIRTLNEEQNIARTIRAVRDAVAEVIVVDSGSTDATVAIAEAEGARVIHQDWLGLGRQKRAAEDQCRHDFLLDLDADEVVTPELAEEIRALFAAGTPPHPIYELKSVTVPPFGQPWPFHIVYPRKLYDRRVVRAPDHKAWDRFKVPAGVTVGRLSGVLLHYSFRDLSHYVQKANSASTAMAQYGRQASRFKVALRVLFGLPFYFFKNLVLRGMFRGGVYGVAIAGLGAFGRWLRDAKMHERILMDRARRSETAASGATDGESAVRKPQRLKSA